MTLRVRDQGSEEGVWTKEIQATNGPAKVRDEMLRGLYSPNIIWMIESRRMR
jgi:hypothetical protein